MHAVHCAAIDRLEHVIAGVFSEAVAATDPQPCGVADFPSAAARLIAFPEPRYILFTADPDPDTGAAQKLNIAELPDLICLKPAIRGASCCVMQCAISHACCRNVRVVWLTRRRPLVPRLCALPERCAHTRGRGAWHTAGIAGGLRMHPLHGKSLPILAVCNP
jgi:hypothetical protein